MRTRLAVLLTLLALTAAGGCARRHCVPESLADTKRLIDLTAPPDAHAPVHPGLTREVEAEFRRRGMGQHPPGARPYHILALSGGGLYGSFGVGLLNGWTEAGTRPQFDVVTGISTGGFMATFAFLGPQYDALLRERMVGVDQRDILRRRAAAVIPFADAVFTSRPLSRQIEEVATPELLCEVARAHAAGRRLYIGTTNLDTRRLIMWDMGEIASRGTPEALQLYRDIVLASGSIPGALPPVRIRVEIDGRQYDELHVDGGVSDEVIYRAFMVADLNRAAGTSAAQAPPGSTLYIISNGKLYAEPSCVKPRIIPQLKAAAPSILYGKTRDELYRIYLNCMETGVAYRLTAIPQDVRLRESGGLQLAREDQEKLFEIGRQIGHEAAVGSEWRDVPPGTDPSEQALPRTGTKFATPAALTAAGLCVPAGP